MDGTVASVSGDESSRAEYPRPVAPITTEEQVRGLIDYVIECKLEISRLGKIEREAKKAATALAEKYRSVQDECSKSLIAMYAELPYEPTEIHLGDDAHRIKTLKGDPLLVVKDPEAAFAWALENAPDAIYRNVVKTPLKLRNDLPIEIMENVEGRDWLVVGNGRFGIWIQRRPHPADVTGEASE